MDASVPLKRTPLHGLHLALQGRMVPFAGYEMPVQYPAGVIREHNHTRTEAGLFDISHMGQLWLDGAPDVLKRLEAVMPGDFQELAPGQIRYSFLLNEQGGVIDDLMVTRPGGPSADKGVYIIVNASGRVTDVEQLRRHLPGVNVTMLDDRALLALQGPKAAAVMARHCDAPSKLKFMQAAKFDVAGAGLCYISRSGYTGEDGFEISVPADTVEAFAKKLLAEPEVKPIGLGARDSLRLEAGLCLYGHDLDTATTPVEANLVWAIGKRRRAEGGFIGADVVRRQLASGVARKLVGIKPEGRALAREQTEIVDDSGRRIGTVSSGGFGPSVEGPVCMGYVETAFAGAGTSVHLLVRGTRHPARVVTLPFVPHRYVKG